jgi:hypothetical protein
MKKYFLKVSEKWDRFFFEPVSPAGIGLFRILLGVVVFLSVLGKYPYRDIFYGAEAIVTNQTMDLYFPHSFFYFRWMPDGDPALNFYFLGFLAATVSLILGFKTRLSSILVFLGLMSLSNRNLFIDNSGDNLLRINAFFLMFSHAGAAYSIDRWIARRKGTASRELEKMSPWAQRLLQLQLGYLYFETAWTKIPGQSWQDGSAIYYALNYIEIRRIDVTSFFDSMWKIKFATYSTIVLELAAAFLIWFRRFRYPVVLAAASLHLMFNLIMQFPIFQYVMVASLVNFLYPEDVEKFFKYFANRWRR